jgi:putative ABC transport system permease protein
MKACAYITGCSSIAAQQRRNPQRRQKVLLHAGTALLGFFAFCGLLMAVIGLYGVISFVAMQRTQEIGVRMARGATRVDILRLIAREGVRLIVLGGVLGLGAALAMAQLLKSLLFNVGPRDPFTYASVALLLVLVALAATLVPAHAAMKVEPVMALRYE